MDFSTLPSLSGEALTTALALDFTALDNDALTAALTERQAEAKRLFALESPSIAEVDVAEAMVASIKAIEGEQGERTKAAQDAANRFAAAKATFAGDADVNVDVSADGGDGAGADDGADADADADADGADSADVDADADAGADAGADSGDAGSDSGDAGGDGVTTASADASRSQKVKPSAAKAVGTKTKRPARKETRPVTITASADVPGFGAGAEVNGMTDLAKALMGRVKGFPTFNKQAAKAAFSQSGGKPVHQKAGLASFGIEFPVALTASGTAEDEYTAFKRAIEDHQKALVAAMGKGETLTASALTAAGWCAPSPVAYNYITNYVIDGLFTVPEVSAPRGGLMTTTGPERGTQGTALDDLGWDLTEAEVDANVPKTFETIECPEFEDHRLDAIGYGVMIDILTKKAYPELVADALRYAAALYAHKQNRRLITDVVGMSNTVTFSGYGPSMTDALEALSLIAVAERRRWSVGINAVMEVKLPAFALEVFRADMSRRNGVALDSVSDGQIAKHFADRRLAVEYVSDWQEISVTSGALVLPGAFTALIYPAGTFVKVVEDVINLSAVYDAASLTLNKYLGVFFEQGYMALKAGYGASKVSIPINTAGEQGALTLNGLGDSLAGGSF